MDQPRFRSVARADELAPGEVRRVEIEGRGVAIYNVGGEYFATDDRCTHMRARLSDGYLEGAIIECPLHFGRFDVRSGQALSPPCTVGVATHAVKREGDLLLVLLSGAAPPG